MDMITKEHNKYGHQIENTDHNDIITHLHMHASFFKVLNSYDKWCTFVQHKYEDKSMAAIFIIQVKKYLVSATLLCST